MAIMGASVSYGIEHNTSGKMRSIKTIYVKIRFTDIIKEWRMNHNT